MRMRFIHDPIILFITRPGIKNIPRRLKKYSNILSNFKSIMIFNLNEFIMNIDLK